MKKRTLITLLLICCFIICYAVTDSLTGSWIGKLILPSGDSLPMKYTFKVDGNLLTGTETGPDGTFSFIDGKVNKDDFSFIINANSENIIHTGKYLRDSVILNFEIHGQKLHVSCIRAH
ncbi:hypothetical protein JN11_01178 [Mucilaginibacter frigoritolerans]|uniref:Glycoside hydrolase n=1 Tax=Mucilaginibacter frigoritolerans TaxID=652788 RepID=A0A562UA54_9SPHI|nr:glycoside hydrolase [Mucilaginibacter frigoritolerans]TWJ02207.1 hypothetical protein JN11_01178 [Mucilaginibacter frigoritolerans]